MKSVTFIFHGSLNDFLHQSLRNLPVYLDFQGEQTTKHLVESLHVPHPEVKTTRVNGVYAELNYRLQDQDWIDVFPFQAQDFQNLSPVRFLLDYHLGKLATYLRILGFDSAYFHNPQDAELAAAAAHEGRILLTRDRGLLMRKIVSQGYCLRSLDPQVQLREIVERYDLAGRIQPFQRCLRCNAILEPVAKQFILDRLKPLTRQYYNEFKICPACDQVYWKGSHYEHMQVFLNSLQGVE